MLSIKNLCFTLPDGRSLYNNLSLGLENSSGLLIYGPTGSGKTTLVKLILGLIRSYRGQITVFENDLASLSEAQVVAMRRKIAFQMEEPLVFEDRTLTQNIALYLRLCGCRRKRADIYDALYEHGFSGLQKKKAGVLSWGEMRVLEMVRMTLVSPRLVVCDQPFAGLDEQKIHGVIGSLRSMVLSGAAVLVTFSQPEVREWLEWPELKLTE